MGRHSNRGRDPDPNTLHRIKVTTIWKTLRTTAAVILGILTAAGAIVAIIQFFRSH